MSGLIIEPEEVGEPEVELPLGLEELTGRRPRDLVGWATAAAPLVALALWWWSLGAIDLARLDDLGLVSVLPATYVAALGVLLVGTVVELTRPRRRRWVLHLSVVVLVVVLYGPIPILSADPRYAWVYKHIAVTRYITTWGRIDRSIEIYQNWSGFPGLAAYLSAVTGLDAMVWANAAQVFFVSANVLAVRYALRALTLDLRVLTVALWLYVLGDWIGQVGS